MDRVYIQTPNLNNEKVPSYIPFPFSSIFLISQPSLDVKMRMTTTHIVNIFSLSLHKSKKKMRKNSINITYIHKNKFEEPTWQQVTGISMILVWVSLLSFLFWFLLLESTMRRSAAFNLERTTTTVALLLLRHCETLE